MKITTRAIPLFLALIVGSAIGAHAQTNLSANFGVGTAWDSATTGCVPWIVSPAGSCDAGGDYFGNSFGGVFGVFGADFMFSHHLGVGGEYSFRFAQAVFDPEVNDRPNFYDFNVIYHPIATGRVVPEIQGGIGGATIRFYLPSQSTFGSENVFFQSADHFQVHGGVGVKIYVKGGIFVKPQFDIRYVPNLVQQFGRDWVPEVTGSVGYTFGEH